MQDQCSKFRIVLSFPDSSPVPPRVILSELWKPWRHSKLAQAPTQHPPIQRMLIVGNIFPNYVFFMFSEELKVSVISGHLNRKLTQYKIIIWSTKNIFHQPSSSGYRTLNLFLFHLTHRFPSPLTKEQMTLSGTKELNKSRQPPSARSSPPETSPEGTEHPREGSWVPPHQLHALVHHQPNFV